VGHQGTRFQASCAGGMEAPALWNALQGELQGALWCQ
jgi:hypothetical protein